MLGEFAQGGQQGADAREFDEGDEPADVVGGGDFFFDLAFQGDAGAVAGEEFALGEPGVGHDFAYARAEVGVGLIDFAEDGFEEVAFGGEEVLMEVGRPDFSGDEADDFVGELDLAEGALGGRDFVEGEADELTQMLGEVAGGFSGFNGLLLDVEMVSRQALNALVEQFGEEVLVESGFEGDDHDVRIDTVG